jgi:peptide/nickel transport system ATP-binding protein
VLRVRELSVRFQTKGRSVLALDRISFTVERGESLALIGESGSGKTTAALSLLGLLPPQARASGEIELLGQDLLSLPRRGWPRIRGAQVAMVFHDPLAALNPVLRIGTQVAESLRAHGAADRRTARREALQALRSAGLSADLAGRYPHQLSGGMRQRAMIAMAIACGPSLLVADEPTSALDAVSQAGIVELLRGLQRDRGIALLLATHDLALAAQLCERIAVIYAGRIVERARAGDLLARPRHPYTAGLLRSLPPPLGAERRVRLEPIPGSPPAPWSLPDGCTFRDRCPRAQIDCAEGEPKLAGMGADREVACFHPLEAA